MDEQPSTSKRKSKFAEYWERNRPLSEAELLKKLLEPSDDEDDNFESHSSDEDDESDDEDIQYAEIRNGGGQNNINIEDTQDEDAQAPQLHQRVWLENPPDVQKIPFSGDHGLKVDMEGNQPVDYLNLFMNDHFFEFLLEKSNNYAVDILANSTSDQSRITSWRDISREELRIFIGILFHMGTIKMNRINDYWKTHYLFNLPTFRSFMSRNRFLLILRALHFNDNNLPNQNSLSKIAPLIDFFNSRMAEIYYPNKELALDESMVLWRGRLGFRQYMQGKRHKYGIKLYILAEPSGLIQKVHVYGGSADPDVGGSKHTEKIVHKLLEGKKNVGHSVYMDNFYNSIALSEQLLQEKTYTTGTLRANRTGNPEDLVKKKLKKGESSSLYTDKGICVTKWKDRKEILSISSEFDGEMVEGTNRRGEQINKPKLILNYNKFMGGIDRGDQMLSYYSCEHKTLRFYKKLGIHIFQIMLMNAYVLFNQYSTRKLNFYDFRLSVIESMLPPRPTAAPQLDHIPKYCTKDDKGKAKRRRCKYCWDTRKIRRDSVYFCPACPNEPGLCLDPCFRDFHSQ